MVLFAVLLSVNFASAVMLYQSTLNLKEESTINMNLLEKYCSEDTCSIYEDQSMKRIMFRLDEGNGLTISAIENKESNLYMISLSATTYENKPTNSQISEGLKLLVKIKIISGMSQEDVAEISNVLIDSTSSIYFKPSTCGESYSDIPDVALIYDFTDLNEDGWLIADPGCSLESYEAGCPVLNCWGDFQRGKTRCFV
jgi:hypothetical protein